MKILAVADEEPLILWDYFDPELVKGVDLIISCGDLKASFLDFLMTMTNAPLLYVHGNHDEAYVKDPPPGAVCIEDMLYNFNGLRILGLGGSMKYRNGTFMHTERQMAWRVWKASWKARLHGGFDILVTHAPCQGYGDMEDLPHRGFRCFNGLLEKWKPAYMLHGHVHKTYGHFQRTRTHASGTSLINCWEYYIFEVPDPPQRGRIPLLRLFKR